MRKTKMSITLDNLKVLAECLEEVQEKRYLPAWASEEFKAVFYEKSRKINLLIDVVDSAIAHAEIWKWLVALRMVQMLRIWRINSFGIT